MHTKTMEGLVGAKTNMDMVNVPIRVYKEARRRGDTATMERAMGYASEFTGRADDYKTKADEGMEEDAKEAREKEKAEREKAIEKRREEREKLQKQMEKNRSEESKEMTGTTIEVSEEGKSLLEDSQQSGTVVSDKVSITAGKDPIIYTKTAEPDTNEPPSIISISV